MTFEKSKCVYCGQPVEIMQVAGRWVSIQPTPVMMPDENGNFELVWPWHFPVCDGRPLNEDRPENQKP